jgi:hypothetical protein
MAPDSFGNHSTCTPACRKKPNRSASVKGKWYRLWLAARAKRTRGKARPASEDKAVVVFAEASEPTAASSSDRREAWAEFTRITPEEKGIQAQLNQARWIAHQD